MPNQAPNVLPTDDWQSQLRDVISSPGKLLAMLALKPVEVGLSTGACEDFALKVPHCFVQRMKIGDPNDPLLRQVLATQQEMIDTPGYTRDPVGENGATIPLPGIIHKYHGRVLLIVSGGCAVNCRYCFRRHFPYNENQNSRQQWREALQYIRSDTSIDEVILSGGDPLVVTDDQLRLLIDDIASISHVQRLRIHSRLPIVIPQRITESLLQTITHANLDTMMVIHCNHVAEIDESVASALAALRGRGVTVLNQAVLLAGINDDIDTQVALSKGLFATGTLPYYLHLLDKVQGAAHFDVSEEKARELMTAMSARLPGFLVPRLVREVAGADAKVGVPNYN